MMRAVAVIVLAAFALTFAAALVPVEVAAQPAPAPGTVEVRGRPNPAAAAPAVQLPDRSSPHLDVVEARPGSSYLMAALFWAFAAAAVGGALFVVTRRNLIAAVMGMVGSFLGIAAVYMMLYASFLAVIQMLVYAGAIMVLFVFVIMILNRPEDEPVAPSGRIGQIIGGLAILYLVGRLAMILINVEPESPQPEPRSIAVAACANRQVGDRCLVDLPQPSPDVAGTCAVQRGLQFCRAEAPLDVNVPPNRYAWGSVRAVGTDLFGPGLFPFEAISILLLIAVVGAIAIARSLHASGGDDEHNSEAA